MEKEAEERKKREAEEARKNKSSKGNYLSKPSPRMAISTPVTNEVVNDQMEEMLEEFGGL